LGCLHVDNVNEEFGKYYFSCVSIQVIFNQSIEGQLVVVGKGQIIFLYGQSGETKKSHHFTTRKNENPSMSSYLSDPEALAASVGSVVQETGASPWHFQKGSAVKVVLGNKVNLLA
jgi:hypothetical protein